MHRLALSFSLLAASWWPLSAAATEPFTHVVLISVDGLHAQDLQDWISAHPDSQLALWSQQARLYSAAYTPGPADSFPGLEALISGADPQLSGLWYDVSWDRRLSPPASHCQVRGTTVRFDESLDDHQGHIDPQRLPRDPDHGCQVVWPHQYVRVNNVFSVVHQHHLRTAWMDKHPAYEFVQGPNGDAVDDLWTPEIGANFEGVVQTDNHITGSLARTEAYDQGKMQALSFELQGRGHDGHQAGPVPALLGLNLQSVSVAQKLFGYDAAQQPTPPLQQALAFCDAQLRHLQATLTAQHLNTHTLLIITAKHGNSPMRSERVRHVDVDQLRAAIAQAAPGALAHLTADDVALIWLHQAGDAGRLRQALLAQADQLGIARIVDNDAATHDARTPDLIVITQPGVIYGSSKTHKKAEHGGFAADDRHVALMLVDHAPGQVISTRVSTQQVAPTILQALHLPLAELDAWTQEKVPVLPDTSTLAQH